MRMHDLSASIDISQLRPFHGYQTSIIPLSSNYYFYLASWKQTPTQFPRFSNVWLVTPEDNRILFSDPPASSAIVSIYHRFDEIYGASIKVHWPTKEQLDVHCQSLDGAFDLNASFDVHESLASRVLVAIGSGPPTAFRISAAMTSLSSFLVNSFVSKGGSVVLGRTETGQPFYHGETENLLQVVGGSIFLNDEDIGTPTNPTWPIDFGDAIPMFKPVVKLGTMYIPFEKEMIDTGA
jgi:hypothetical protein